MHLSSDEWYAKQYGDYLLHETVNQSLDLTIESLGREKFKEAMQKFQTLKKQANNECADYAHFPCSATGKPQPRLAEASCYRT